METDDNVVSGIVVDAAMRVHSMLGPGLLESAYQACLAFELQRRRRQVRVQANVPIMYDGFRVEQGYRADLIIDESVIVELKTVARLLPIHEAQILSYLRLAHLRVGLLINFHVDHLRDGIRRFVV